MNKIRQLFTNDDGQLAIVQPPNLPIIAFVGFKLLSLIASGQLASVLVVAADVSLLIWAAFELLAGDSWFRRFLGLGVAVWLAVTRLM